MKKGQNWIVYTLRKKSPKSFADHLHQKNLYMSYCEQHQIHFEARDFGLQAPDSRFFLVSRNQMDNSVWHSVLEFCLSTVVFENQVVIASQVFPNILRR